MKDLKSNWNYKKLDQLGVIGRGKSRYRPRNDPSLYGGLYPFFQTGDVKAAELYLYKYSQTYNEKGLDQSKLWEPGTLLITIAANIAESAILSIKGCFPDSIVGFIADSDRSDVRFVKYALDTLKLKMQNIAKGTTQDNLSLDKLLTIDIPTPPLTTQRKIAAILSAYDDLIENNTRRIAILEEMARELYREWFVRFRFPGHDSVEMLDSELGMIPAGWEVKPLSDVCLKITDGSHWSPKGLERDGYPMASVKDMNVWDIQENKCRRISQGDYMKLVEADCKPLLGDVLVAKDGSYLKHIFSVKRERELVILSSIAILRPNEQIFSDVLSMYLREPSVKSRMIGYVSGVAIPRIVLKDFSKFLVLVPLLDLQKYFLQVIDPWMKMIYTLLDKNTVLRATRDMLLPHLISGELDVTELEIAI